jgi:hypothetical protein
MLAYVFWHWPKSNIKIEEYVRKLSEFHASLARHAPRGFSHSVVVELTRPPWLNAESVAFEDWYLVKDSAVLDQLNFAAVSGENELPHNQVAFDAAGGTAGLYRLKLGDIGSLQSANVATWFSKTPGANYDKLCEELNPLCSRPGVGLWCRQMTLGPTTEFCLRTDNDITLPSDVAADIYSSPVKTIWPQSLDSI